LLHNPQLNPISVILITTENLTQICTVTAYLNPLLPQSAM